MKTRTNKTTVNPGLKLKAEIVASQYGTLMPSLTLEAPREMHWRKVAAALHRLAAAVQEATPLNERWCVVVDAHSDSAGRVNLELAKGEQAEADRGLAVLEQIARAGL